MKVAFLYPYMCYFDGIEDGTNTPVEYSTSFLIPSKLPRPKGSRPQPSPADTYSSGDQHVAHDLFAVLVPIKRSLSKPNRHGERTNKHWGCWRLELKSPLGEERETRNGKTRDGRHPPPRWRPIKSPDTECFHWSDQPLNVGETRRERGRKQSVSKGLRFAHSPRANQRLLLQPRG